MQGTLIAAGVSIVSCLLITRVRKLCASVFAAERGDSLSLRATDEMLVILQKHRATELQELHTEIATLRKQYEALQEGQTALHSNIGRQANINGFAFENDTLHALPEIISRLYKGEVVRKVMRNVEGRFARARGGKSKHFELDALVITTKRVFVIETKIVLKAKNVDHLARILNKFSNVKFADAGLSKELQGKPVHGGFSYLFDMKETFTDGRQPMSAAKYAREQYQMLTVPRLIANKTLPSSVEKLRDFRYGQ